MQDRIENSEQLFEMLEELKAVNRKAFGNILLLDEEEQNQLINEGKLFFDYAPSKYLNIWFAEKDYYKLYFSIADMASYDIPDIEGKIVCEIYAAKQENISDEFMDAMKNKGLAVYSSYHKWKAKPSPKGIDCSAYVSADVTAADYPRLKELINKGFDAYSDHVPEEDKFDEYLSSCQLYKAVDDNAVCAGLVVLTMGNVENVEYVFSDSARMNKGYASSLFEKWIESHDAPFLATAWIRDDNEASVRLHSKFGFEQQKTVKITLIR